jgi:DNA polymerase I
LLDINGLSLPREIYTLLGAMARHRLPVMIAAHKEAMRGKILDQDHWTPYEAAEILSYCAADVDASERLLRVMAGRDLIDWDRATWRGAYMAATAHISHNGIPVDAVLHGRLKDNWPRMKQTLIERVDANYGVFVGDSFNRKRFAAYLARNGIPWPRLPSGQLQLEQQVFKSQAEAYPVLAPLRELTLTLAQMRSTRLSIGADGHNRYWLAPLRSKTGRNPPSSSKNILGSAAWLRGLITPPPDHGLATIDWSAQEIAIAAGRSGGPRMCAAYRTGDVHMAVAIDARLAPSGASKATHP